MRDLIMNLFSGVLYPILTTNDVFKGLWRGTYEAVNGRPLKTAMVHSLSQTVGAAVGRAADSQDDRNGFEMLRGNNMVVQTVVAAGVSGGNDYVMGRGGKFERFIIPATADATVELLGPMMYNGNPRIV